MGEENKADQLDRLLSGISGRTVVWYTVPEALRFGGVESIGLAELTVGDEIMAAEPSADDGAMTGAKVAYNLVMRSFVGINGEIVDGPKRRATYHRLHPKLRSLANAALTRMQYASGAEQEAFFASATTAAQ